MALRGRIAVITGGASGIGEGVVKKLALQGATCIILGRNEKKALKCIETLSSDRVSFLQTDVTHPASIQKSIEAIHQMYGRIDILVNCAGTNIRKPALEYTLEEWTEILNTNLTGVFLVSQAVAKVMQRQSSGSIVNIGSMISHYGVPNVAAYGASKGAINQLTKTLAVEWAPLGIRVNQVSPGYIETPLIKQVLDNGLYRQKIINRTPLKRMGSPEDVANMIAYLVSDDAEFITGQIIAVDGGILGGDPTLDPLQQ